MTAPGSSSPSMERTMISVQSACEQALCEVYAVSATGVPVLMGGV